MSKFDPFKKKLFSPNFFLVLAVLLLIGIFVTLLLSGTPAEEQIVETVAQDAPEVPTLETTRVVAEELVQEPQKEVITQELDDLCEDYSFNQGDVAELDGNTLSIDRIGPSAVLLTINGQEHMLSEGDDERVDRFLVELADGDLLYFGLDDPDNTVLLRLGCKTSSEDPNDKYVREKGQDVCEQLIRSCESAFDVD